MTHAEDGKRTEGGSEDDDLPDDLAGPARRALTSAGYTRLEQLAGVSEAEVRRLHGTSRRALEQTGEALHAREPSFTDPGRSGRIPSSPGRSRTGRTS